MRPRSCYKTGTARSFVSLIPPQVLDSISLSHPALHTAPALRLSSFKTSKPRVLFYPQPQSWRFVFYQIPTPLGAFSSPMIYHPLTMCYQFPLPSLPVRLIDYQKYAPFHPACVTIRSPCEGTLLQLPAPAMPTIHLTLLSNVALCIEFRCPAVLIKVFTPV